MLPLGFFYKIAILNPSMLESILKNIGLSDKEARVYLAALELGEESVQRIAKKAKVNRPTAYNMIRALMKRGLMSTIEKGKKQYFSAESPERLMNLIKAKEEEHKLLERSVLEALPELKAAFNKAGEKPRIRYFEGKEGLKEIQMDIVNDQPTELLEIYSEDEVRSVFTAEELKQQRERLGSNIRLLNIYNRVAGPFDPAEMDSRIDKRWVNAKHYPFTSDIGVYGNKVFIASLRGKLQGVIIDNKEIAKSFRSIFELASKSIKK